MSFLLSMFQEPQVQMLQRLRKQSLPLLQSFQHRLLTPQESLFHTVDKLMLQPHCFRQEVVGQSPPHRQALLWVPAQQANFTKFLLLDIPKFQQAPQESPIKFGLMVGWWWNGMISNGRPWLQKMTNGFLMFLSLLSDKLFLELSMKQVHPSRQVQWNLVSLDGANKRWDSWKPIRFKWKLSQTDGG